MDEKQKAGNRMIPVRWMMNVHFENTTLTLWRDVRMPALPPVGCVISTPSVEYDCLTVEKIWYLEEIALFVVSFENYDIADCAEITVLTFEAAGWKSCDWESIEFTLPPTS